MIDSFVGGGPPTGSSLDRAGPIQNQSEFSVPNVKTGKYKSDINREVIHEATTDSPGLKFSE